MTQKTVLEIDDEDIIYKKTGKNKIVKKSNLFTVFCLVFIILFISILFFLLQNFEWHPLEVLAKFKRIKKTFNSWYQITAEKTAIEINKGKLLYVTQPNVVEFQCLDYNSYYAPGRLSGTTFLPEFIRRGNSGPWVINKADKKDPSALQFCKFLINKYTYLSTDADNNFITCGMDMFNKLGYTGYFVADSPCENAITALIKNQKEKNII